jgi:hypothetical protein
MRAGTCATLGPEEANEGDKNLPTATSVFENRLTFFIRPSGLPDVSWYKIPKNEEKCTKLPRSKPNVKKYHKRT